MSTEFRWKDRWFISLFFLGYMFNFVDRTIIAVVAESIRAELRLSDLQIGLMGGLAFSFFYAVLGIPIARYAERVNRIRLIACVTAFWSVMTMLCGASANFLQLLLARMGVGGGEAGYGPALVSVVSDRFPAERRGAAFSLMVLGSTVGGALAAVVGGYLAVRYGWRVTFVIVGAPGLLLALLMWLTIEEPARPPIQRSVAPSFGATLRILAESRAFIFLTIGSSLANLVGFGLTLFLIPLLVRLHGFDLAGAGIIFAITLSLASFLGMLLGGYTADALGKRNVRWIAGAPALAMGIALPFYVIGIYQDDWKIMMVSVFVAYVCVAAFLPAIIASTQRLVEPRMRASAAAIHNCATTIIGLGAGSVILGFLSDTFAALHFGTDYATNCTGLRQLVPVACADAAANGLRSALLCTGIFLPVAGFAYYVASTRIKLDLKN